MILLNTCILKTVCWRYVLLGIMDQCDTKIDIIKYMWVSDLYFMVQWLCPPSNLKKLVGHIAFGSSGIPTVRLSCFLMHAIFYEPCKLGFWNFIYCIETPLGHGEEIIRFWWPWPHFQGHTSTLNVKFWPQKKLVCTLSLETNDGFWPNFMYCIIGIIKRID